jgi:TolB-like protein/Tfp pilus assembly protein PilF
LRVAVLPLANISNNPQDEYFADGMTEELISSLSKISGLNVIARTSVMKYKTTDKDISQIGKELMVGSILEGSVRKMENRARITVQLINVSNQEPIWSTEYDRDLKDIFMTQSEIAQKVADELRVRLVSSEREQLEKSSTENMTAFQEYLIGKYFLNQKTPESIRTALVHFQNSIKADSAFTLPYASMAYCYTLIGVAGFGSTNDSALLYGSSDGTLYKRKEYGTFAETKAKEAVMKALQIDPTLAEAHASLGYIKFRIDWDWKGAEEEFKKAIALKPGYSTAHEWYALFLAIQGRLDEALTEMQTAYRLDPLSTSVNNGLARIYHFRNETDKALAQADKTIRLDSNYAEAYFTKGITYFKLKDYQKSQAELQKAIELSNRRPVMVGLLGCVYAKEGKPDETKKLLAELETAPQNSDKLYAIAVIKINTGQQEDALKIFEKLISEKYGIMIYLKVERDFFEDVNDSTYQHMLKKMEFF